MAEGELVQKIVPEAAFIEDVAAFVKDRPIDEVLAEAQATLQRYTYVSQQLQQKKQRLTIKEPEIKKCLECVNLLIEQRDAGVDSTLVDFSLSDQVYARAHLREVDSVGLWLGAGVMVEYSLNEAKELLEQQLGGCRTLLESAKKDFEYIRDQVTTVEVSLARIYNYDVARRKEAKESGRS